MAIDPGKNGGIAWRTGKAPVRAAKMPEDPIAEIRRIHNETPIAALAIEKQSMWRSDSADEKGGRGREMQMQKLIKATSEMVGAIKALGIPIIELASISWQSKLKLRVHKDPRSKAEKKKGFQNYAQTQCPHLRVTLNTADAICMLAWLSITRGETIHTPEEKQATMEF